MSLTNDNFRKIRISIRNMIKDGDLDILTSRMIKKDLEKLYKNFDIQKNKTKINQIIIDEYNSLDKSEILTGSSQIKLYHNDVIMDLNEFTQSTKNEVYDLIKDQTKYALELIKFEKDVYLDIFDDIVHFRYEGFTKDQEDDENDKDNEDDDMMYSLFTVCKNIIIDGKSYFIRFTNYSWDNLPTKKPSYSYEFKAKDIITVSAKISMSHNIEFNKLDLVVKNEIYELLENKIARNDKDIRLDIFEDVIHFRYEGININKEDSMLKFLKKITIFVSINNEMRVVCIRDYNWDKLPKKKSNYSFVHKINGVYY